MAHVPLVEQKFTVEQLGDAATADRDHDGAVQNGSAKNSTSYW